MLQGLAFMLGILMVLFGLRYGFEPPQDPAYDWFPGFARIVLAVGAVLLVLVYLSKRRWQ